MEDLPEEIPAADEDHPKDGTYHPDYIYSYDQDSYHYSYSLDLTELQSYSFDLSSNGNIGEEIARSITVVDVSLAACAIG